VIAAAALAKGWLSLLAMTAAQGALLALVAYAIAHATRPRPAVEAALWLVVAGKLALPWGPAMPWSLADLIAGLRAHDGGAIAVTASAASRTVIHESVAASIMWIALVTVWGAGAAVVAAKAVRVQRRAVRALRVAQPAPAVARAALAELAAHLGVRAPRLVVAGSGIGPHVVGVWRPTIAIPEALLGSPRLLRAALAHELVHVRRRDMLARVVQLTAAALLWWFPLVPRVSRRLELAREAACDAGALEIVDLTRGAYARLLVDMAALRAVAPAMAARHALDARIAAVLGRPQRARVGRLHRALIGAWLLLALGGARSAEARGVAVCRYTPALAEALYLAYPEADLDGDGMLSRDEACELQAELRHRVADQTSRLDPTAEAELQALLAEPLCCNRDRGSAYSSAEDASCHSSGESR
jgi:beta-lactamase regulating signal transducer with metallopeptidase domain